MNQTSTTAPASSISSEAISSRAYELWEREGRPAGSDQRHWFEAEQQLRAASDRSVPQSPSRNSDITPLKGTRAGAAAESAATRNQPAPASTTSGSTASAPKSASGKRASANPFPGKKPSPAL